MRGAVVVLAASACWRSHGPAESPTDTEVGRYDVDVYRGGKITVRLAADRHSVAEWIENSYAIPVAIELERELVALHPSGEVLSSVVVQAHGTMRVALWDIDGASTWHERSRLRTEMGSPKAEPRRYLYALPFSTGEAHRVIQSFNGRFSHKDDRAFAVDFAMPEGTIVRAARDGVVVAFNDKAVGHSLDPALRDREHANWIVVLHDDGTLGQYWHLMPGGVAVRIGQHVARGDVLGKSGFTGFATSPHLHFDVSTARDGLHVRTFPFAFKTRADDTIGEAPVDGETYTAFE